ncbi:MAG: hypothetical protein NC343_00450 [Muribaculum sp.]|nr:hypothetical protein [Muribaculaceae bacterium]MCM1080205.1 hypothetical protein [Muribaculum sp.]
MQIISKSIIAALIAIIGIQAAVAQELEVKEMRSTMDPMTVEMQRRDLNNEICALVKVQLPVAGAGFEGNIIGDTPYKINEYWVYLTPGTKFLQVKCPGNYPLRIDFRNYGINGLQSKCIYELLLSGFTVAQAPAQQPVPNESAAVSTMDRNRSMFRYVENINPQIVTLIEHPFGIHVDGDPNELYNITVDQFKQLINQDFYKVQDDNITVAPMIVQPYGTTNRLWPMKAFHDGHISQSMVFSMGKAKLKMDGFGIGNALLAATAGTLMKQLGSTNDPDYQSKLEPGMSKKEAKALLADIDTELKSTGNYRELPLVKKDNKLYDELTRFYVNDKLDLIVKFYYKDKQLYCHRVAKSLAGTGIPEMNQEWWCGLSKPQ